MLTIEFGNTVTITQPQGGPQISVLGVQLAQLVSWQVDLDGGASTASLDLHTTRVRGVDLTAGASSLTTALPARQGPCRSTSPPAPVTSCCEWPDRPRPGSPWPGAQAR